MGSYEERAAASPLVRCVWRAEVDADGTWVDPATEFWGIAFGDAPDGRRTAELIGPSLVPRTLTLAAGERSMQRLFGRTTGLRRVQITQLRRAARAYLLLQEGTPIAEAAARTGFSDQAHLTRAMRGFVGRTPARIIADADRDGGNVQDPGWSGRAESGS